MDLKDSVLTFEEIGAEAFAIHKKIYYSDFDRIGQEGIFDAIKRLFIGLLNTIIHSMNTFKTNVFSFYKNLKRTELKYFHESNRVSINRILNFDYATLTSLQIPYPKGMIVDYFTATQKANICLGTMNMEERSRSFVELVRSTKDNILANRNANAVAISNSVDLPTIVRTFQDFNRCFNNKVTTTLPFIDLFPTETSFKDTDSLLMTCTEYEYTVNSVYKNMETCTELMNEILSYLEKEMGTLTKQELLNLSDACNFLAKLLDMFGVSIQDVTRIEHNFVEVLTLVKRQYNL